MIVLAICIWTLLAILLGASLVTKLTERKRWETKIMATQAEVVEELRALKTQTGNIRTEVVTAKNELQATIARLEAVIAAGNTGEASAELVSIKDELKAELQGLDDLHLDKPGQPLSA